MNSKNKSLILLPIDCSNKIGSVEDIYLKYITILAEAIQINYNKTSSSARGIVCSDTVSNIFIVMLKRGDNTLNTIETTCNKAATLYTESLFLLEYCLSEIKLKQITDIKRFVYLKTIGSYEITPADTEICSNEIKIITKTIFIMKEVIQHLIQCTVDNDVELSRSKLITLLMNVHTTMLDGGSEFVLTKMRDMLLTIGDGMSSENYTTEDVSALLIEYSIQCMIYKFIYDQIQDNEVAYLQFMNLQLDDKFVLSKSKSFSSDLLDHPLYIQTIKQLLADA